MVVFAIGVRSVVQLTLKVLVLTCIIEVGHPAPRGVNPRVLKRALDVRATRVVVVPPHEFQKRRRRSEFCVCLVS